MSKGMIWLVSGGFKVIEAEKAVDIWQALNGEVEPTEAQADFLPNVRDVFIPPSYRHLAKGYVQAHKYATPSSGIVPKGYKAERAISDTTGVPTGNGILQGSNQALPTNDR